MTEYFTVFPAIDLRRGEVVRLQEGDPARQTTYSAEPAQTARRWASAGARWLHVVNLDGAFGEADPANRQALANILAAAGETGVSVQFGGGLRTLAAIEQALEMGVQRAILGTAAVEQPALLAEALGRWGPERLGASLDALDGQVRVRGWTESTALEAVDLAGRLRSTGLRWLVFTDIARDGLERGANIAATAALARASRLRVIASGGVSRLEDVHQARDAGLAGIIVGRALYSGAIAPEELFS